MSAGLNLVRSGIANLCAGKDGYFELGLLWMVVLDSELRAGESHTTIGPWEIQLWTAITILKLSVEWGIMQVLAVWTPGPSLCVIAS